MERKENQRYEGNKENESESKNNMWTTWHTLWNYSLDNACFHLKDSAIHDDELLDSEWQVQDIQACGVLVNF